MGVSWHQQRANECICTMEGVACHILISKPHTKRQQFTSLYYNKPTRQSLYRPYYNLPT